MKSQDTRKALLNELHRVNEGIQRHYENQRAESMRLGQTISNLNTEKTALHQEILRMQARIEELETQIGTDDKDLN